MSRHGGRPERSEIRANRVLGNCHGNDHENQPNSPDDPRDDAKDNAALASEVGIALDITEGENAEQDGDGT